MTEPFDLDMASCKHIRHQLTITFNGSCQVFFIHILEASTKLTVEEIIYFAAIQIPRQGIFATPVIQEDLFVNEGHDIDMVKDSQIVA